ncbi:putative E3 ubiquitin ligase RBR family [Helianthus annuus]|uniref:E3 ubiquitin ligase RBR family n=1 Tax=Helianthus annuus TaxID=4232 RepID=A0A9K3GZH6_HELAN|nr:putative E3 ubiquitin ligase RBR family [Helianthus annuus]KAJ0822780.1 putative E3 ubiquitin ligase RBR family [Helianthus annuus]
MLMKKLGYLRFPIRCLSPKCKYYISVPEHKSFLPVGSFMSLQEALLEPNACAADKFYCPFADCAVLLDPRPSLTTGVPRTPSSSITKKSISGGSLLKSGARW